MQTTGKFQKDLPDFKFIAGTDLEKPPTFRYFSFIYYATFFMKQHGAFRTIWTLFPQKKGPQKECLALFCKKKVKNKK